MNQLKRHGKEFNISQLKLKLFTTQKEKNMLLAKEDNISKEDIPPKHKLFNSLSQKPMKHLHMSQPKHHMLLEQHQTMYQVVTTSLEAVESEQQTMYQVVTMLQEVVEWEQQHMLISQFLMDIHQHQTMLEVEVELDKLLMSLNLLQQPLMWANQPPPATLQLNMFNHPPQPTQQPTTTKEEPMWVVEVELEMPLMRQLMWTDIDLEFHVLFLTNNVI